MHLKFFGNKLQCYASVNLALAYQNSIHCSNIYFKFKRRKLKWPMNSRARLEWLTTVSLVRLISDIANYYCPVFNFQDKTTLTQKIQVLPQKSLYFAMFTKRRDPLRRYDTSTR